MTLTYAEIKAQDNRALLEPDGVQRTIDGTPDVLSLLVSDKDSRVAARIAAGSFEETRVLICVTADLPAIPVPEQSITVDTGYFIVADALDEEGMLYLTLRTRRA